MKKIYYILLFVFVSVKILSQQGIYVDQATIYNEGQTLFYIEGDLQIENGGTIENYGDIELTQHWINNAGNTGLINNRLGTVFLTGGNQFISGISITHFSNLSLLGGSSIKETFQDVIVTDTLLLNNSELQVHQNIFHLTNPLPSSLMWNNGFISGDSIGGYFARSTNRIGTYRFPVGNLGLFPIPYRAVDVTPTTGDSSVYGVRLARIDASLDYTGTSFTGATGPYDRIIKEPEILEINPVFYHHIVKMFGNDPANIRLYYFASDHLSQDRKLDGLSQWNKSIPQWEFRETSIITNYSGPNDIGAPTNYLGWLSNSFDDDPFVLSVMNGLLVFVPQIFSPNGDGANDILFVRGRKITSLTFIVYNRWGEKIFETNDKNFGWDGKFRGKDAQSSVYVYYLDAEVEGYGPFQQKGNITLVR